VQVMMGVVAGGGPISSPETLVAVRPDIASASMANGFAGFFIFDTPDMRDGEA